MIHIIIATIEGREAFLKKLLESIDRYFTQNHRIYVVRQYKFKKVEINKKNLVFKNIMDFGASNARNIGINLASRAASDEDFFLFPDDDCFFREFISIKDYLSYELILLDIRDQESSKRLGMIFYSKGSSLYHFYKINCPRFFIKWSTLKGYRFDTRYGPGSAVPAVEETELLGRILSDKPELRHIQLNQIIYHPLNKPTEEKTKDYAFAQGFLLREFYLKNKMLFFIYLKGIVRPFFGFMINIFSSSQRKYYQVRMSFILRGFFHDHS